MDAFDFWYAVNNTEVVLKPRKQLETFGNSTVNYVLISEMMDEVNKVRIREGTIIAAVKYAEKTIPDGSPNVSQARLDEALKYVLAVYAKADAQAVKEGIQITHERMEAGGVLK